MARVKTTLMVEADGTSNTFSNTKNYTQEKTTKYTLDEGTAGAGNEFYIMHSFSPSTKSANSSSAPKAFCIYNSGTTGAEVQFETTSWQAAAPDIATSIDETSYMTFLLGAGEMMFSNQLRLINYSENSSAALGDTSALALATDKVSTALSSVSARGGDTAANIDTEDAADATAIAVDNFAEKFREGDYVFFDLGTDDVIRVVSVDSATAITAERGVLGYTAQTLTAGADLYMYAGSHLHNKGTEDDSGVNIRTDAQGRFRGMLLGDSGEVPRGSTEGTASRGIVPGSIAIQFPEHGGYQNLGISVSASDSTGLVVSTAYAFRITDSLATTSDIEFTTDSSDVSWGKVITLINTAFKDADLDYTCGIVNGDVRFSALKWIDGDSITLVDDADSSNEPWGVGNVPDTGAMETPIKTRFPRTTITDVKSGEKVKNTKNMLIDDGNGNLIGDVGSGKVDYDSAIIDITSLYRAEFKTAFNYGSTHSGIPTREADNSNMVGKISGRSTNSKKNAELTLIIYS
tara:strand:+ start:756 stop:2309 length:1554 start_codon:yes stop_codon:yes gene_type:complete